MISVFEMMVEDVSVIYGHTTVSGKCKNRNNFTSSLVDNNGAEYKAAIPFIKHVDVPDTDYITLELLDVSNPNALKGKALKGH